MSQLMIQSGAGTIAVGMKCDVECFFYWYGPPVENEDDELTMKQYNDFITTGLYKKREEY